MSAAVGSDWSPADLRRLLEGMVVARARLDEGLKVALGAREAGAHQRAANAALSTVADAIEALEYSVGSPYSVGIRP